jgi:hypothetical protein
MLDEKDIEMSNASIDMPPLGYEVGSEPTEPTSASQLPPELQYAQQIEREAELAAQQPPQAASAEAVSPQRQPELTAAQQEYDSIQARNFRALKEAADRAARERDELAKRLAEYENRKFESSYEDLKVKEEDLVEGKHFTKAVERIKQLEEQQRRYMQQNSETAAEIKLRQQYPDFDKVMTLENVQMLSASYPEVAKSLNAASDLYEKASSAYTIIKKFGIYSEQPTYEADKQKALSNAAKPRPLASVSPQKGDTPLSRANAFASGLTEELKAQLRKEMDEYAKMV